MGATVDVASRGRLDFGIGAGWNEREHRAYGIPLYKTGERIRRLGEACEVIRRMWTEQVPSFEGAFYQIAEAYCEPKPIQKPHPPFVIGGSGEQLTLRVVARYADIWNFAGGPVEDFARKSAILDEHCAVVGRDPAAIERIYLIGNTEERPLASVAAFEDFVGRYAALGFTDLVFHHPGPDDPVWDEPDSIVEDIAADVLPRWR